MRTGGVKRVEAVKLIGRPLLGRLGRLRFGLRLVVLRKVELRLLPGRLLGRGIVRLRWGVVLVFVRGFVSLAVLRLIHRLVRGLLRLVCIVLVFLFRFRRLIGAGAALILILRKVVCRRGSGKCVVRAAAALYTRLAQRSLIELIHESAEKSARRFILRLLRRVGSRIGGDEVRVMRQGRRIVVVGAQVNAFPVERQLRVLLFAAEIEARVKLYLLRVRIGAGREALRAAAGTVYPYAVLVLRVCRGTRRIDAHVVLRFRVE